MTKKMIDISAMDKALTALVEKKNQLSELDYNDKTYDKVEEALHDLEDDFVEEYGEYIEDVLMEVHDEICPDNEVLLPTAYLADRYLPQKDNDKSLSYEPFPGTGVIVDADDYPNELTRLVLAPKPTRLILQIGRKKQEQVWEVNGQKA